MSKNKRYKRKAKKLHGKCMRAVNIRKKATEDILSENPSTCCFCEFGIVDNDLNMNCKEDVWGASIRELERCLKGDKWWIAI